MGCVRVSATSPDDIRQQHDKLSAFKNVWIFNFFRTAVKMFQASQDFFLFLFFFTLH